jgi:hypothetical protein
MQGGARRQVNAEEMLAELKRALESSTPADVPPPSAPTVSLDPESWRSQVDQGSDHPLKVNADDSIGQPADLQKPVRLGPRTRKLTVGGLALAGAAAISASFAFVNRAPSPPKPEPSVVATEGLVRPQNEQTLAPSSAPDAAIKASREDALLQVFNSEKAPVAGAAPENGNALPAGGKGQVDAPHVASLGLESAAPAFTPAAPNPGAAPAPAQAVRPDGPPPATAPSTPASTDSAPPAETPKPNATPTAHASNESARPSTPKSDSKKKPPVKTSLQKPAKTAKASAKPVAQAERQASEPARPKEAEKSPQPAQDAGNPPATPVAPVAPPPSVQQRFADGMTHAFGYLIHLPGSLVPHPADPNADAH